MKILLLGHASSSHTLKWVRSIATGANEILLLSLVDAELSQYESLPGVTVACFGRKTRKGSSSFLKLGYLNELAEIRRRIRSFAPDVLHAHYASSYGLLGALSGFHPLIVSVWGSDVYDFPTKSPFHRMALQFVLSRADRILSTSRAMAVEAGKFSKKPIDVTPFNIDTDRFRPDAGRRDLFPGELVVGTVKALERIYGQEYLLRAFSEVAAANPGLPLRLAFVGQGRDESRLKTLTKQLGIEDKVAFAGLVPNDAIHEYQGRIDVFVALSNADSFGVTVLESQACGKPVVVTSVGGLPEVVEDGVTGFVVPPQDSAAAANAIGRLVRDPDLRSRMGSAGRKRVEERYSWKSCIDQRNDIYASVVEHSRKP